MASGSLSAMSKSVLGRLASRTARRAPAIVPRVVARFATSSTERDAFSDSTVIVTQERPSSLSAMPKNVGEPALKKGKLFVVIKVKIH